MKATAYMINEDCVACGACQPECPNEAISEGEERFAIDPGHCTECVGFYEDPQCASVCPVEAPVPDPERPETREELLAKKERLHGE